jgi:hypothetical protein
VLHIPPRLAVGPIMLSIMSYRSDIAALSAYSRPDEGKEGATARMFGDPGSWWSVLATPAKVLGFWLGAVASS